MRYNLVFLVIFGSARASGAAESAQLIRSLNDPLVHSVGIYSRFPLNAVSRECGGFDLPSRMMRE